MSALHTVRRRGGSVTVIVALMVICLSPFYWMITTSLQPLEALFQSPPALVPDFGQLGTYGRAISDTDLLRWVGNSALIALGVTVLSLFLGILAGFALSQFRFAGRGLVGFSLLVTQMLPEALLIVPLYTLFVSLGLLNNLGGLILADAAFVMPVVAWIMKGAFDAIPRELAEAARLDGCDMRHVLLYILLPLVLPSIAASSVIAFFFGWNEYMFALTFVTDREHWAASVGLASLIGQFVTPLDTVFAVGTLYAVVPIVFYVFAQKRIISGLTAGAIKG